MRFDRNTLCHQIRDLRGLMPRQRRALYADWNLNHVTRVFHFIFLAFFFYFLKFLHHDFDELKSTRESILHLKKIYTASLFCKYIKILKS
jgi:hypothetical protein